MRQRAKSSGLCATDDTHEALEDAAIDAAVANDPDWADIEPIDWSVAEVVVPPKKQAISIRLDEDLIGFFKAEGPGYQRRINAVLRGYVIQRQKR
jgi:uncharacterized protein (DUF4415 family)